jgi:hypothetical protein
MVRTAAVSLAMVMQQRIVEVSSALVCRAVAVMLRPGFDGMAMLCSVEPWQQR